MKGKEMDLKRKLEHYRIPVPDQEKKRRGKMQLQELNVPSRMTDVQFILGQIGFIRLRTWIGALAVPIVSLIIVRCFAAGGGYTDYRLLSLLSAMTPLFLVFHVEELARICYKSMLEIEMATKYSLKKLVLSRLCILGITDLAAMGGWVVCLNMLLEESLFEILLYSLVPFNLTVLGMLRSLKYSRTGRYAYRAFSYTAIVCVCFVVIPRYRPIIYNGGYVDMWLVACIISVLALAKTIREIWKDVGYSENMLIAES